MKTQLITIIFLCLLCAPRSIGCTAFVVYRNDMALAGNNEDFWLTDTKMWFVPKEGSDRGMAGRYGRVYFGFSNFFPQGGMSEAGIFFDGFATGQNEVKDSKGRKQFAGNLTDHAMAHCKTVDEIVALFEQHDLSFLSHAMLMFADKHGNSAIIEGDKILRIEGDHQVVTNFYQSKTAPGTCPCPRYAAAKKALEKGNPITVKACRDILAETRQNAGAPTQYSNVYDLKKGLIYLYHFHHFEEVVSLDLKKELAKGAHEVDLPTLFPRNDRFHQFQETRAAKIRDDTEKRRAKGIGPDALVDYEGTYAVDVGQPDKYPITLMIEDKKLWVRSEENETRHEIFAEAPDRLFRIGDYGLETYTFGRDKKGRVSTLTLKYLGRTLKGSRLE